MKQYGEEQFYHVYNRGVNKANIFEDELDYKYFLTLLKQRLSPEITYDRKHREVANFSKEVDLVAYCLMPNHYHLMFFLKEKQGIERLMRSAMTAYSGYFNKRHGRVGSLFQNHFLASRISSDVYLWQVSRYIHLNPLDIGREPEHYPFSSLRYYDGRAEAVWLQTGYFATTYDEFQKFKAFVLDDSDRHQHMNVIKYELANPIEE